MLRVGHAVAVSAFFALWILASSAPGAAQGLPAKVHRIGVLDSVSASQNEPNLRAFREGLSDLGYVEGRHFTLEYRSDGRAERIPDLAAELARGAVDVVVTGTTSAALAAQHATEGIPIVMAVSGDPVFAGLVASLARPGANVTGLHTMVPATLAGQRLRFLKDLVPGLSRVGVVVDAGDAYALAMAKEVERVASAIGVHVKRLEAQRPEHFPRVFEAAIVEGVEALIVLEGILTGGEAARIVEFATLSRLPAIYGRQEFVAAGGLMSYGPDVRDLFRRAAGYVHRILTGTGPAELPVAAPAKYELLMNLKAAQTLGLTIPPSLQRRVDRVLP